MSADTRHTRHPLKKPVQTAVLNGRTTKASAESGEYHRLRVQFGPPDDGPVRPETCRGKRITDTVRRREKQCIKLEIKKNKILYVTFITSTNLKFYFAHISL